MLKPNAERIAWFLNLTRLLRFQKYFLAPRAARMGRSRPTDELAASRSSLLDAAQPSFLAGRLSHPAMLNIEVPSRSHKLVAASGLLGAAWAGPSGVELSGYGHGGDAAAASSPSMGGFRHYDEHIRSTRALPTAPWRLPARQQVPYRTPIERSQTASPLPAGPVPPLLRTALASGSPQHNLFRADVTTVGLDTVSAVPPPPPVSEATEPRQISGVDYKSFLSPTNNAPNGQEGEAWKATASPGKASPGATVYLDGSALGRWAIQHFERALGKPATGMTGVDPRASLPRGRVSPF